MFHYDYLPKKKFPHHWQFALLNPSSLIGNFTNSIQTEEVRCFSFFFFLKTLYDFLNFEFELTLKDGEGLVEVSIITASSSLSKFTAREAVVL